MRKNSPLSRKRNTYNSKGIKSILSAISISLLLVSCGSSKPRVITTKVEAREFQQQSQLTAAPKRTQRSIAKNAPERPITEPLYEEVAVEEAPVVRTTYDIAIDKAMQYEGVRYKYGGSSEKGMDCSGLLNISFSEAGKQVPRNSRSFFDTAAPIDVKEVKRGDLMFFATGRDRKRINHVALVVEVTPAEILFVHATVSEGVKVSSFNEAYWLGKYRSAGRLF